MIGLSRWWVVVLVVGVVSWISGIGGAIALPSATPATVLSHTAPSAASPTMSSPAIADHGAIPGQLPTPVGPLGSAFGKLFAGTRPDRLGVDAGQLGGCPASPNCVSSSVPTEDAHHAIAPLALTADPDTTFAALKELLRQDKAIAIQVDQPDYVYAEATTALMGFVDDVEFYVDRDRGVIQVRSASRLGESDLGVNRQRIEALRTQLANVPSVD